MINLSITFDTIIIKTNITMSKRISVKLSNENDWLLDALKKEQKKTNRPSVNNTIETILVNYFKHQKTK